MILIERTLNTEEALALKSLMPEYTPEQREQKLANEIIFTMNSIIESKVKAVKKEAIKNKTLMDIEAID